MSSQGGTLLLPMERGVALRQTLRERLGEQAEESRPPQENDERPSGQSEERTFSLMFT